MNRLFLLSLYRKAPLWGILFLLISPYLLSAAPVARVSVGNVGSMLKANMVINALLVKDYKTADALFKDEKALLYTPNEKNTTPLGLAIQNNDTFMLQTLLKRGAPLVSPYYSKPLLVLALYNNAKESLVALLEAGADARISYHHLTLLQMAVLLNKLDFCTILLRYGASADESSDPKHLSPLSMALIQNSWDIVELLIQTSDDLNSLDQERHTPLDFLILQRPSDVSRFLDLLDSKKKKQVINFQARKSLPPLFLAIDADDTDTTKTLLEAGADVNKPLSSSKETPLMRAVGHGNQDMVTLLMQYNPNLGAKDRHHKTARSYAKGNKDLLDLLSS